MKEKQTISIKICLYENTSIVKKWFKEMLLFTPTHMTLPSRTKSTTKKYKQDYFFERLNKEFLVDIYKISCSDDINNIHCFKNSTSKDVMICSASIDIKLYKTSEKSIMSLIDEIMNTTGIVAIIYNLNDWFWQNNTQLNIYEWKNRSLDGIPLKPHRIFKNEMAVDVEKFPGYDEQIDSIWFGAAWKMWFGEPYYEFISKEAIENFKDCYKNEKTAGNCRCITLYEDMDDYENPANRARQWKFKEAIDFQNVIEKLRETGINRVDDPELEIEIGEFAHGGIRLFKGYFDDEGNSVPKSKASKMKISEHGTDGSVLWEDEHNML